MYEFSFICLYSACIIGGIDVIICYFSYKARWFQLHAVVNYIISALTFSDMVDCLFDPSQSMIRQPPCYAAGLTLTLHLYHSVLFKMRLEDWCHHISGFVITPILIDNSCKGISQAYFFITGLPGAIDYSIMALYKNNILKKNTQKYIASKLNAYIRMPGGVITAYLIFKDSFSTPVINYHMVSLCAFLYINSCFYGKQAIENYGYFRQTN